MPRYFQFLPTLMLPQMLLGNALALNPSVRVKFEGEEWGNVPYLKEWFGRGVLGSSSSLWWPHHWVRFRSGLKKWY